ncbi:MAG: ornithine carbamoyltransferase [Magnetococcales bacterium]|nr:ornithine carbamoyltransferase [Magnetococcales bacterium]
MPNPLPKKHDLLTLDDVRPEEMSHLFHRAGVLKGMQHRGEPHRTLEGRTLGMIFEKSSTRTRVSFEAGMFQLGGMALFLSSRELQLGRGEPIADSARVLSRYVDGLMVRTFAHQNVELMAQHAGIPVINGLSDSFHPCQVLADLFTFEEQRGVGSLRGKKVAWIGDGNNMANTWIQAARMAGFHLVIACPREYQPCDAVLDKTRRLIAESGANASVEVVRDPREAAAGAHLVTTDVWTSMGQEEERLRRQEAFKGYVVDGPLMALADKEALFMHCLPAHRGEEVSAEVIDGPQSVVWDEAENRLHVQKAILEWLMRGGSGW